MLSRWEVPWSPQAFYASVVWWFGNTNEERVKWVKQLQKTTVSAGFTITFQVFFNKRNSIHHYVNFSHIYWYLYRAPCAVSVQKVKNSCCFFYLNLATLQCYTYVMNQTLFSWFCVFFNEYSNVDFDMHSSRQ